MLSKEQILEIESNRGDSNWWAIYGEGKEGKLEGLIYDFEQVEEMPNPDGLVEAYGMDFGFTNDPTALLHCIIDTRKKHIYLDELCYDRGMLNSDIIAVLKAYNVSKWTPIFADCAEPKTIMEIKNAGYNCQACYKATKKAEQIQSLKGYKIFITKRSTNTIKEIRNYVWLKDRAGNQQNEPTPFNDHAMDAFRYGCFTYLSEYGNKGKYNITIR